jgi:hypothetical protein
MTEVLFPLLQQVKSSKDSTNRMIARFVAGLKDEIGALSGGLSFGAFNASQHRALLRKLAKECDQRKAFEPREVLWRDKERSIEEGLLKAAAIALTTRMRREASMIINPVVVRLPTISEFDRSYYSDYTVQSLFLFVCRTALSAASRNEEVDERMLMPSEFTQLCTNVPAGLKLQEFCQAVKKDLEQQWKSQISL